MDKKNIIIIVVIIAVIAIIAGYFMLNNQSDNSQQTTLILSKSAYMEVPEDANATSNADKKGIFYYVDAKDGINITSSSNISASSSASEMKKIVNSIEKGAKKIVSDDVVMYLKDGVYSIFLKNTQYKDSILIQSTNKNLLLQCWQSIKFHSPTDSFKIGNTSSSSSSSSSSGSVVDAVQQTQKAVGTSSSSSSSTSSSSSSSSSESFSDFSYSRSTGGSSGGSSSGGGSSTKGGSIADF